MSLSTNPTTFADDNGDFDRYEFDLIVDGFDEPTAIYRPTKAAERREGKQIADLQLGIRRHRTGEREV
jgi:hypothetical protein